VIRHDPVLVAWTTPDYVSRLQHRHPEEVYFIVDSWFKDSPDLDRLDKSAVIFTGFEDLRQALRSIKQDLLSKNLSPRGVACFDCEALIPASFLAREWGLPFPDKSAIARARNKYEAGRVWKQSGVRSPSVLLVSSRDETLDGFRRMQEDVVLKPVSGSGSELVFHCRSEEEVVQSVRILERELPLSASNPLFQPLPFPSAETFVDPRRVWIMEEFVSGPEFSCDFLLEGDRITLIRETGKVKPSTQTFGSVLAYTYPPFYPENFSSAALCHIFRRAAGALGFTWGHFMVDFILHNGHPMIIEMTPRPGGDSIPDLLETATGTDLLELHLNFVAGFNPSELPSPPGERFASINLFAAQAGKIIRIDPTPVIAHPRVRAIFLRKRAGDRIVLPPKSYDHRLLGHTIVSLDSERDILVLSTQLEECLKVEIVGACLDENPTDSNDKWIKQCDRHRDFNGRRGLFYEILHMDDDDEDDDYDDDYEDSVYKGKEHH